MGGLGKYNEDEDTIHKTELHNINTTYLHIKQATLLCHSF